MEPSVESGKEWQWVLHRANAKFIFSWWNYRGYIYNQIEYNSPSLSNEWEITVQRLVNYSKHSCSDAANAGVHFSNANDTHYFCLLNLARRFPLWVEWGREKAMPWRFSTTEAVTTVPCSCSYLIPSELNSGCLLLSAFCSPHWIRVSKLFHW